jgi:glucoamylase
MRDAALSMRALMITNNDTDLVQAKMEAYVQWVLNVQSETDPNQIDVRIEPKFYIPSGAPYDQGWCRPQTDGPGLRAGTNSLYAIYLMNHTSTGQNYVKQYLYTGNPNIYNGGAIKYDLDWVADNWQQQGCDLWEEIESDDFFWNRYNFRYGLTVGATVADTMGDHTTANKWRSVAKQIEDTLLNHYNGQYVYESTNREKDVATICGFNDGYLNDDFLPPTDYRVSGTISTLNDVFNQMFPINYYDTRDGLGGILYGRYEGDHYAGGNPWILSTAALAQLYYNGAKDTMEKKQLPSPRALKDF